jgi:hypothetical protein
MLMLSPFHCAGKDIEKACQGIYPLQNTFVRKVKVLRSPKFDVTKLMEVHGDYTEEVGAVSGLALHALCGKFAALARSGVLALHSAECWCQAGRV